MFQRRRPIILLIHVFFDGDTNQFRSAFDCSWSLRKDNGHSYTYGVPSGLGQEHHEPYALKDAGNRLHSYYMYRQQYKRQTSDMAQLRLQLAVHPSIKA
jgi:hypothetical protein